MSDGINDIYQDQKLVEADIKARKAKENFERNMEVITADDLLTSLGKMKYMARGYWKSVDLGRIDQEIEKYQKYLFYEID
jgi:hypothetical protein